jgi:hypothetical protein
MLLSGLLPRQGDPGAKYVITCCTVYKHLAPHVSHELGQLTILVCIAVSAPSTPCALSLSVSLSLSLYRTYLCTLFLYWNGLKALLIIHG